MTSRSFVISYNILVIIINFFLKRFIWFYVKTNGFQDYSFFSNNLKSLNSIKDNTYIYTKFLRKPCLKVRWQSRQDQTPVSIATPASILLEQCIFLVGGTNRPIRTSPSI